MNMIKISIAAMALAVGFAAVPAIAQSRDSFQNVDGNGDGFVTYDEARRAYPTLPKLLFLKADDNHDGVLDEAEYGELRGLTAGF